MACKECDDTGWVELFTSVGRCKSCSLGGAQVLDSSKAIEEFRKAGRLVEADILRRCKGLSTLLPFNRAEYEKWYYNTPGE